MSRFFRGDSDSDTESSSSEDSYFSEEELSKSEVESGSDKDSDSDDNEQGKTGASAWLRDDDSGSESEEEVKHVMKSAKDKRFDEIEASQKVIENNIKTNDWVSMQNEFEKLNKVVQKLKLTSIKPSTSYFKCLILLEDALQTTVAEKKKMNGPNSKAMNSMKQKLKKNNKEYEGFIASVREGKEIDEPVAAAPVVKTKKTKQSKAVVVSEGSDDDGFTTVGKGGKKVDFSPDVVLSKLKEIIQARGKKNTDKDEQVQILKKLLAVAVPPRHKIKVLFALISSRLDYGSGMGNFITNAMWLSALEELFELFTILEQSPEITISENYEEVDEEDLDKEDPESIQILNKIQGSVISIIERLDEEFTKALQNTDPNTKEYIERLSNEPSLIAAIIRGQIYFESKDQKVEITRSIVRRIEHLYYKPQNIVSVIDKLVVAKLGSLTSNITGAEDSPLNRMNSLSSFMYKHADPLLRTRTMLYHIYSVALQGEYHVARDMLLMSHLQESIHQADVPTMIIYNRTMVQIGLAAFKKGLIRETLNGLQEIYNTGRVRELLGQGVSQQRYGNVNPEQEKLEKLRMLPFHMHINLEFLECVYLTSSMLLEIPNMARAGSNPDARKNIISKPFRRHLDQSNRQVFSGPPENTREHIIAASKALSSGDWEGARDLIWDIKIWDLMVEKDLIKEQLASKIQEQGLRAYLFNYSAYYSTLNLDQLASMFGLSKQSVISIISKMIWNEELVAGLDQIKGIVVLHAVELSKVQLLSVLVGEKLSSIVEINQKGFDNKMTELDTQHHSQPRRKGNQSYQGKKQIDQKYNSNRPRSNFHQTNRNKQ